MEPQTVPEKFIRRGSSLCSGEQEFVAKRKNLVLKALRRLGIDCGEDSVPHVAVLGSGGGQRAAVALMGSLFQMKEESLLDTVLYLGGISGSTWTMASLYGDKTWSSTMHDCLTVVMGPGVGLEEAMQWLVERSKDEDFSLTDVWAALTTSMVMKRMDTRHLSEDATKNVINPYPVYCAIEKSCHLESLVEGTWFEVTPHEAGFSQLGLFVDTARLGCKFLNGDLVEEIAEMDIVKLQGLLGSALAEEETIREYIPAWMKGIKFVGAFAQKFARLYSGLKRLVTTFKTFIVEKTELSKLDILDNLLEDASNQNHSELLALKDPEGQEGLFRRWIEDLLAMVKNWIHSLKEGVLHRIFSFIHDYVLPLLKNWEWGTTNNFLLKYTKPSVPSHLHSQENIHLIDAGIMINVPYPAFLGSKRDVDLMIALEYSAGEMFETLTLARDYAAAVNESFPEIPEEMLKEKDWPKDFYVLEGSRGTPSIAYMPLFNQENCKDAEEVNKKKRKFSTFQLPYPEDKAIELLEIAKANMKRNRDNLLRELQRAVESRQNRKTGNGGS